MLQNINTELKDVEIKPNAMYHQSYQEYLDNEFCSKIDDDQFIHDYVNSKLDTKFQ